MDSLTKWLKDLQREVEKAADDVNGSVPFTVLFNPEFMGKYSEVATIEEFFYKGSIPDDPEELKKIPEAEMDAAVRRLTQFESWEAMKQKAGKEYIIKKFAEHGIPLTEQ